jgi:lipopolysaccharide export system permease protein
MALPTRLKIYKKAKDSIQQIKNLPGSQVNSMEKPYYTAKSFSVNNKTKPISDSIFQVIPTSLEVSSALSRARLVKGQLLNFTSQIRDRDYDMKVFETQWNKIFSNSLACIAMFLIGAPLGAIIKRGGLGIPVLVSILFFIIFYVLGILGEKWGNRGLMPVAAGVWMADFILFGIGFVFLRQARKDVRLFEADFYSVVWDKMKMWLEKRKITKLNAEKAL